MRLLQILLKELHTATAIATTSISVIFDILSTAMISYSNIQGTSKYMYQFYHYLLNNNIYGTPHDLKEPVV